jgi:hypothetical protein
MQDQLRWLIGIGLCSAALGTQVANHQIPVLSVCEVIEHRDEYNGKMVGVRGTLKGTDEGMWLTAAADCKYKLITKGFIWPNMVSLEYPNNGSKDPAEHTDFDVDWTAMNTVGIAIPKGFNPETDEIIKTYVGLFQTFADLESRFYSGGEHPLTFGFGHLGAAPARILVKTVKDVTAVRIVKTKGRRNHDKK